MFRKDNNPVLFLIYGAILKEIQLFSRVDFWKKSKAIYRLRKILKIFRKTFHLKRGRGASLFLEKTISRFGF